MEKKQPAKPPKPVGPKILNLRDNSPSTTQDSNNPTHESKHKPQPEKKRKPKRWRKLLAMIISLAMILGGLYILFILIIPKVSRPSEKSIRQRAETVTQDKNQVFIPSVGIQSEIKEGGIDILDQGVVWHRLPERGNPEKGGNFILTGHSFVWGYTPQEVTKQSVFYHLAKPKRAMKY